MTTPALLRSSGPPCQSLAARQSCSGRAAVALLVCGVALAVLGTALGLLVRKPAVAHGGTLTVFCAAGLKPPIEALARTYEQRTGTTIQVMYEGSGTLLARIAASHSGDLFIAADRAHIAIARSKNLVREAIPLARQRPMIAVAKGNPKNITSIDDLLRADVRVALANPDATAIGALARKILSADGRWTTLSAKATVLKPTVMDVATDIRLGAVDAGFVWDATIAQVSGLTAISDPVFAEKFEEPTVAVLDACTQPAAALRFARFLAAPETGNPVFTAHHYESMAGDAWSERPELTLYSGAVNRPAIEAALASFEQREGVHITQTYNGCGILCAAMRSQVRQGAAVPDVYYACDVCFVAPVADLFPEAVLMTETDIVVAVPAGNPHGVRSLADLARAGMRVGVSNAEQATLGFMTKRLLDDLGLTAVVRPNIVTETPTGDLLINELRAGALDAVIVYRVNVAGHDDLAAIAINDPRAKAVQPFAVARTSPHRQLARRLLDHLVANREKFVAAGFRWRGAEAYDAAAVPAGPAALGPAVPATNAR